ncbi:MAG: hypothetical protein SFU56_02665 [Capsulimonadales bacterium]|nr:hypothetical protein [Capsulimonadales bacterium]
MNESMMTDLFTPDLPERFTLMMHSLSIRVILALLPTFLLARLAFFAVRSFGHALRTGSRR